MKRRGERGKHRLRKLVLDALYCRAKMSLIPFYSDESPSSTDARDSSCAAAHVEINHCCSFFANGLHKPKHHDERLLTRV